MHVSSGPSALHVLYMHGCLLEKWRDVVAIILFYTLRCALTRPWSGIGGIRWLTIELAGCH